MTNSNFNIALFVPHKAASVFVGDIVKSLCETQGMTIYKPGALAWGNDMSTPDVLRALASTFEEERHFLGPLRDFEGVWDSLKLENYRIIVHVRDPRDCLVSLFYSKAYSHNVPDREPLQSRFLEKRQRALDLGLEAYVMQELPRFQRFFSHVKRLKEEHENLHICRYEDMVWSFPLWLLPICDFVGIPRKHPRVIKWLLESRFNVGRENINRHERQVTPGDFRRKLSPEMQEKLTEAFADYLPLFGYDGPAAMPPLWTPDVIQLLSELHKEQMTGLSNYYQEKLLGLKKEAGETIHILQEKLKTALTDFTV